MLLLNMYMIPPAAMQRLSGRTLASHGRRHSHPKYLCHSLKLSSQKPSKWVNGIFQFISLRKIEKALLHTGAFRDEELGVMFSGIDLTSHV